MGYHIPELRLFPNLTLKIKCQCHGWGLSSNSQCGSNILSTRLTPPFIPCESAPPPPPPPTPPPPPPPPPPPIREIQHFQNLTFRIQVRGQMTMMLHNYRSRQFHRTSNDINPFNILCWVPGALWFDLFWHMGKPIWRKWANNYDVSQLQVWTIPQNFEQRKSVKRLQRYGLRKSGSCAPPPHPHPHPHPHPTPPPPHPPHPPPPQLVQIRFVFFCFVFSKR